MTSVSEVFEYLQKKSPFELQMDFDNSGFLVGHKHRLINRVLISLDITEAVVQEAIGCNAQLILSHHPIIFGGINAVTDETPVGRTILLMAEHGISAICAHTNLDAVEGGVNDALASRLGLTDIGLLSQDGVDSEGRPYGIGRIGTVERQDLYDFALNVKQLLDANGLRIVDGGKIVQTVAVGGGSCGSMLRNAVAQGCDTFITADVKYDVFLEAAALGINLIDAGHFPTENVVCPVLMKWLKKEFPELEVHISKTHSEVISYL